MSSSGASLGLIGRDGGRVTATGESFVLSPDATLVDIAARIERVPPQSLGLTLPAVIEALGAVQLSLNGVTLGQSGVLSMPRPEGLVDDTGVVIARLVEIADATRLQFVAVGRIAGDTLASDTAVTGLATLLPGVREGGRYIFLRITQPLGLAFGLVRGVSNLPAPGALVTTSTLPARGNRRGRRAVRPCAHRHNELTATDVASFDAVTVSVAIADGGRARADLRIEALAPRVTSVTPVDGEGDVALAAPVVLSFSEPIAPASGSAIVLEATGGGAIATAHCSGATGTVRDVRATDPLASKSPYRVRVTTALQDAGGRNAATEFASTFTTIDLAPRPTPPAAPSARPCPAPTSAPPCRPRRARPACATR